MGKIYKWGILGAGNIAQKFASDLKLLSNAKLYAVGSRDIERATDFAQKFGAEKAYGSYEEFVKDPDIDVVYVASRHVQHYSNSLLCLKHGKAVLCEKPVAMNLAQCKVMMETARKNNLFFMEALWTRFIPSFLKCLELIREGAIGEVKLIQSDFSMKPAFDANGRLFNQMLGGGALLDIGIYPAFLALEIAGKPESIAAFAEIGSTRVDETCSMMFRHDKGIISVLSTAPSSPRDSRNRLFWVLKAGSGLIRCGIYQPVSISFPITKMLFILILKKQASATNTRQQR